MEPSILSLLPPVVTIGLAIATRRVLLALGIGVLLGALMYSQWNILNSISFIAEVAGGLIIAEGAIAEEMYILAFVVLLGVLTSFIYISGGLQAVSEWAITKVKTRFQAQLVPYVLGIVIFFDDAFSSLVGGNVSRTITDPIAFRGPSSLTSWTRRPRPSSSWCRSPAGPPSLPPPLQRS